MVCGCGVLVGLCLLARNPVARWAGMTVGSIFLDTRVEIAKLEIGWSQITVDGITVFEPAFPDQVQFHVARVAVIPSLKRGFSDGVWLERVTVDQPEMHLRFDQHGNLLSVFPESSGQASTNSPLTIPLQYLVVNHAAAIVHQTGREELRVKDINLQAEFSDAIVARAQVPEVLTGSIDFQCQLDARTFAGTTKLNVLGIELDTEQLASLPLVPQVVADHPSTASVTISFQGTHPPGDTDLRHHTVECLLSARDMQSRRFGMLCPRLDVEIKQAAGVARVTTHAALLGGDMQVNASADLNQSAITGEMTTTLRHCNLHQLTQHVPELHELAVIASGQASVRATWDDGKLDFQGDADTELNEFQLDSITLPVVTARASTQGTFCPGKERPLRGVVTGLFSTTGLQLSQLAKRYELPEIAGEILASGSIELLLEQLTDPTSYHAETHARLRNFAGFDMHVPDSEISATLSEGIAAVESSGLFLQDASGKMIAGVTVQAQASLGDHGRMDASAEGHFEPSPDLIRRLGLSDIEPQGRLSCHIDVGCLLTELANPRAWTASAAAETQSIMLAGEKIGDMQLDAELTKGLLTASPIVVRWRDNECTIRTEGEVGDAISVCAEVDAPDWKLEDAGDVLSRFSKSPLPIAGRVNVDGQVMYRQEFTAGTRTLHAFGNANLEQAVFARTRIGDARLRWLANFDGLVLSTSSDDFLGGRFDVNARVAQLDWTKTEIDGTFTDVQVPRLVSMTRQRVPSTGILEGGFRVTSIASLSDLTGDAWMRSGGLTLQRVPVELTQAHVSVQQGVARAGSDGEIVGGRFHADAQASLTALSEFFAQPNPRLAEVPITSHFRVDNLPLASLAVALQLPRELRFLGGTVSAAVLRDEAARDGRHLATVTASVDDLRWKHAPLSDRITAGLVVHPTQVELNSVQGRFADGNLSGKAAVHFVGAPAGRFDFIASRVNLRRATSPFGADVSGSGSVKIQGRLGHAITGRADVTVDNAVAAGVGVRQVRLPIDWTVTPTSKTVRWQCRAGTASLGGGNVRIATQGSYAHSLNMNSTIRVERVDLAKLMQNGSAGSGIVDGEVILRAKQARSPQQLVGTYDFEMKNIQALEIPVLDQLPKMVSLSPPTPGRGQDGATIHGRIGGGLVHVDEIAVHQSNIQVLVSGQATMQGKLDLDVIVSTESTSPTDQLISMLDSPLMLAAPAPIALIAKANDLLKDRVVRVHVGGTAGTPTLRLQPGKQLTQDAVRFFLSNSFGSAATQVANLRTTSQLR